MVIHSSSAEGKVSFFRRRDADDVVEVTIDRLISDSDRAREDG